MDQRQGFYSDVLAQRIPDRAARVLVLAAGARDKGVFEALGFTNVVFSNVDDRSGAAAEFAPFGFSRQDAENLTFPDAGFDYVVIHAALHHCHSPHRALLEMYRVARMGVLAFEARDSLVMRLLERLGLAETYEQRGVYFNGGAFGGVRNGSIPNFIYRWTEREIEKTVSTFAPHAVHAFGYHYGHDVPAALLYPGRTTAKRAVLRTLYAVYQALALVLPRQQNLFALFVEKPARRHEWVKEDMSFDMTWGDARFGHVTSPRQPR